MKRGGGEEPTGHAQVNAEPSIRAKAEKHLFAVGVGGVERAAANFSSEEGGGGLAKNTFLGLEMDRDNFMSQANVPFFTKIFNFSKFGHGGRKLGGKLVEGKRSSVSGLGAGEFSAYCLDGSEVNGSSG